MLNRELLAAQVIAEYSWQHFCGRILEKLRIETDNVFGRYRPGTVGRIPVSKINRVMLLACPSKQANGPALAVSL
jgi:hypothetical protein